MKNLKAENCLIAYFSRKGNNYVSGKIVNLSVGNTSVVAKLIAELTGGTLFQIESQNTYPDDYTETTEVAQQELRANARPMITGQVENMDLRSLNRSLEPMPDR
jgi:flavodoxin